MCLCPPEAYHQVGFVPCSSSIRLEEYSHAPQTSQLWTYPLKRCYNVS